MADTNFIFKPDDGPGSVVIPVSGASQWVIAIGSPGLFTADGTGGVCRNRNQITDSTRNVLIRPYYTNGTTLHIRQRYPALATQAGPPAIIKVFGAGLDDAFAPLRNVEGVLSVPIPFDLDTDPQITIGSETHNVTVPDNTMQAWDCQGCDKFVIAVERALDEVSNLYTGYFLEAKID